MYMVREYEYADVYVCAAARAGLCIIFSVVVSFRRRLSLNGKLLS